jgi:iron complex transport system substrate-binding protein
MASHEDGRSRIARESTRRRLLQMAGSLGVLGTAGCLGGALPGGSSSTTPSASEDSSMTPADGGSGTTGTTRTAESRTVTDATGRTVELPESIEDIVAVGPGALNLVAYLEATDMLVGVESCEHSWAKNIPYNLANPELRDLPVIGPHKGGDPELIVDADPDVVVATYFTAGTAADLQGKIDRPVVVVKAQSRPLHRLQKAYGDLRFLARILGREERAETVIESFESERTDLDERTADVPTDERPAVYYAGRSDSGGAGATSTQHPFAPFAFVNADNVADSISGHATVNEEKLLTWDPSVIFVAESNLDRVKKAFSAGQYSNLTAVEEGNLYGLLPTRFYGNLYGSTLADAYYVGTVLYPDRFSDVDPAARADEIYETLFGTGVYDQLAERFGGFTRIEL